MRVDDVAPEVNAVTGDIVDAAIAVHRELGPGLYESVYERCLFRRLGKRGWSVRRQVEVPIVFDGEVFAAGYKADLIVDDLVVVEVKAVDALAKAHFAQLSTYVRLGGFPAGLLMNFDAVPLREGIKRLVMTDAGREWR